MSYLYHDLLVESSILRIGSLSLEIGILFCYSYLSEMNVDLAAISLLSLNVNFEGPVYHSSYCSKRLNEEEKD